MRAKRRLGILAAGGACCLLAGWFWIVRPIGAVQSEAIQPESVIQTVGRRAESVQEDQDHLYTNRLIHEKSPYLLLHAHNPVDWYPWGEEAFEKARREQKPIFLSIGYSTCHWCHVMERESFSDPAIAELMNRYFVSIKVDREERPDIDRIYMAFVVTTTGSGGWPMSVFLAPDRKPFYGGTYFPKENRFGRPGFRTVIERLSEAWEQDREKILTAAREVTEALAKAASADTDDAGSLQMPVLDKTYRQIKQGYDEKYGGFGKAPKFPRPVVFNFLLRYYARTGQKDALEMTRHTLRAMAQGGIHDHLGGGFHRYSTDARWHVPHFEKMLYDQAQLVVSYVEAYQATHDPFLAEVARDILEYVLRDMRGPEGGFYSAEDADSLYENDSPEHGEGAFYIWKAEQIEDLLGADLAAVFNFHYGVQRSGNVPAEQDLQGEFKGRNILIVRHSLDETAQHFNTPEREIRGLLDAARGKLLAARSGRPRPPLDDKVLTAWNGMMISAFAKASQALDEQRYLAAAEVAASFLKSALYDPKAGHLKRRYRNGHVAIDGFLADYAFLIQGLIDLYEASFDVKWLSWADELQEKQDHLFWDSESGGYFDTTGADPSILFRTREDYDGAEPSANSVAAMNLLRLWQMTGREQWKEQAGKTFAVFSRRLQDAPQALPQLVAALDFSLSKPKQIVIAGQPGAADTRALLRLVHERYIPNKFLMLADGANGQKKLAEWLPFIEFIKQKQGRATAYICENYVCKLPTADLKVVARLLDSKS
ncbi:MAG: thioredoxin domain-containing protein [Acidobacteria bacterium]|nr:thioredoxin domain-containing protein [Acidobacteriota bacterium]